MEGTIDYTREGRVRVRRVRNQATFAHIGGRSFSGRLNCSSSLSVHYPLRRWKLLGRDVPRKAGMAGGHGGSVSWRAAGRVLRTKAWAGPNGGTVPIGQSGKKTLK